MRSSELREFVLGYGHENILATHKTTLELTKDKNLSKKGECIVTSNVNKALADLSAEFKANLRKSNAKLTILIEAGNIIEQVNAYGSPQLIMTHSTEMVIRKSEYMDNRTLAVHADKAARDLSRKLVEKLKNPRQKVKITLEVCV
jgi:hypothetical protein